MRTCQLFSLAVVAVSMISLSGCATPASSKATGLSGANSPIQQAMEAEAAGGFAKRGQ